MTAAEILVLHAHRQLVARDAGVVDEHAELAVRCALPASMSASHAAASLTSSTAPLPAARAASPIACGAGSAWWPCRSPLRRARASASAMARPMPREAPVTSATSPASASADEHQSSAHPRVAPSASALPGDSPDRDTARPSRRESMRSRQAGTGPCPGRTRRRGSRPRQRSAGPPRPSAPDALPGAPAHRECARDPTRSRRRRC